MACFSVCEAADIVPNAHISVNQMRCSHSIQKHHPAAVKVCAKILLQHTDGFHQLLLILVALSLSSGLDSCDKIPVCLQPGIHVGPDLGDHFLQLRRTLLDCLLHHIGTDIQHTHHNSGSQYEREQHRHQIFCYFFPLRHLNIPLKIPLCAVCPQLNPALPQRHVIRWLLQLTAILSQPLQNICFKMDIISHSPCSRLPSGHR